MLGGEFLCDGGNLRRSDFDHSNLFKPKKERILKFPLMGVNVKFWKEDNVFDWLVEF